MRSILYLLSGAAAVSLSLLTISCGDAQSEGGAQASPAPTRATPVRVETLEAVPFGETLNVTGYLEALQDVTLSTEEGGVARVARAKGSSRYPRTTAAAG